MNDYVGKICPFCKSEFKPNDEIVVCSACDMPHHKDCWIENQGCTTFGCLGSIKSVDGSVNSVTSTEISFDDTPVQNSGTIYCTRCGSANSSTSSFCSKCGNSLSTTVNQSQQHTAYNQQQAQYTPQQSYYSAGVGYNQTNGYNQPNSYSHPNNGYAQNYYGQTQATNLDPELIQLIGTKTEYYVPKFQEMKAQNKKNTWNWAAFWITPYWFLYRKMYGLGFGILAGAFILSFIPALSFFLLGGYIVLGIFANYIYMNQLENKMQQAKYMNEPMKSQFLLKNGGTNTAVPIVTFIGFVILTAIFSV